MPHVLGFAGRHDQRDEDGKPHPGHDDRHGHTCTDSSCHENMGMVETSDRGVPAKSPQEGGILLSHYRV